MRKYLIFCVLVLISFSNIIAQTDLNLNRASIITAYADYLGKENVIRNNSSKPSQGRYIGGTHIAVMHTFRVKIFVSISKEDINLIQPLYVRLSKTYLINENINNQETPGILEFEFKVNVSQSGWSEISIGDFSDTNNIIYDKRRINLKY